MQYRDVFAAVLAAYPDAAVVSTCGHISRDLFNVDDRPGNFYLVGSMGMATPVGIGVALAQPQATVVVFDGDGALAMNMSAMRSVAASGARIIHVVLDNGQHGSTGGQRSVGLADIVTAATAVGYQYAGRYEEGPGAAVSVSAFPALIHASVDPRDAPVGRRVDLTPQELRDRFAASLSRMSSNTDLELH